MPPDIRINALKNFSGQSYATEEWTKEYLGNYLNFSSSVNSMELDIGVSGKDNLAGGIPLEIFAYNPDNLAIQVLPTSTIAQRDRWTEIYYLNGTNYTKLNGSLLPALRKGAFVFYGSNTAANLAKGKFATDISEVITLIAEAKKAKVQLNVRAVNTDGTYAASNVVTIPYTAMDKTLYVKESENSNTYVDITLADGFSRIHSYEYTDENETFCVDLFTPGKKIYIHPNDADFTGLVHQCYNITNVAQVNTTAYEYFFVLTLDKAIVTDETTFSLDELGTLQNTMLAAVASLNGENAPTVIGDYNASVGFDSFTGGNSNHNLSHYSFVYGIDNTNAGELSVVLGTNNVNYSAKSLIVGGSNVAGGDGNYVFGTGNSTHGYYSMVIGSRNTADGVSQMAIGHNNVLHAQNCISIGQKNTVSNKARNSVTIGCSLINESEGAIAIGASVDKSLDNRYGVFLPGLSVKSHKKELNPLYNPANDTGNTGVDSNGNEQYVLAEEKAYSVTYKGHWLAETQIFNDNGNITLDHDKYSRWQINSTGNVVLTLANWKDGDTGLVELSSNHGAITVPAVWVVPEGFDIPQGETVLEIACVNDSIYCHVLIPYSARGGGDVATAMSDHAQSYVPHRNGTCFVNNEVGGYAGIGFTNNCLEAGATGQDVNGHGIAYRDKNGKWLSSVSGRLRADGVYISGLGVYDPNDPAGKESAAIVAVASNGDAFVYTRCDHQDTIASHQFVRNTIAQDHNVRIWDSDWITNITTANPTTILLTHNLNSGIERLIIKVFLRVAEGATGVNNFLGKVISLDYNLSNTAGGREAGVMLYTDSTNTLDNLYATIDGSFYYNNNNWFGMDKMDIRFVIYKMN